MTLVFILHRKLSNSGVFGKHNCRPLYNRSHFCSQQVQELPWTFLIVTINKCVWDSSFNLIMFDQWSLWQSSINSNNLLRYKNNEIFIILDKNEHQITARERKLPESLCQTLLSVIIDHW